MTSEELAREVERRATVAAVEIMDLCSSEEARRWALLRYVQRVQSHLEMSLLTEVQRQSFRATGRLDWEEGDDGEADILAAEAT